MSDLKKQRLLNTNKIKALLTLKGISRQSITKKLNISYAGLNAKLNNVYNFSADELKILSDILDVSIDYLYTDDL